MKILDNKGRLFGKISIIDVLVVLVVVVMAFALYMKNNSLDASKTGESSNVPITFVVEAEHVPLNVAEAIRVDDIVYDKDRASGGAVGKITNIEVQPAARTERLDNGTYASVTSENACNLLVTIEGTGSVTNGYYAINKIYEIGINAARNFYTNYAVFTASVVSIG